MAKAPEDLTITILREIRGDLSHRRERADQTTDELKALRRQIYDGRETTATATGFATHANIRSQAMDEEIIDLRKRVEKLESAK